MLFPIHKSIQMRYYRNGSRYEGEFENNKKVRAIPPTA